MKNVDSAYQFICAYFFKAQENVKDSLFTQFFMCVHRQLLFI